MLQVLDVRAYEARQREYAIKGHRHFYFMTLNGSEVCGNLFATNGINTIVVTKVSMHPNS